MSPKSDQELSRLRVDAGIKRGVQQAAAQLGITESAWRKLAYVRALTEQLGPQWRSERARERTEDEERNFRMMRVEQ
jgi:hypothetical protein